MHGHAVFDLPIPKSFPLPRICIPQFGQEKLIKLESSKFCRDSAVDWRQEGPEVRSLFVGVRGVSRSLVLAVTTISDITCGSGSRLGKSDRSYARIDL